VDYTPLVYLGHEIDDLSGGNGDGDINPGETCGMSVWVKNQSAEDAHDVQGTLRCSDPLIGISDSVTSFGFIAAGDSVQGTVNFTFDVSMSAEDAHILPFQLIVADSSAEEWESNFTDLVKGLDLGFMVYALSDASGDGIIDPDESVEVDVTLQNGGLAAGTMVQAALSTDDPYVDVDVDLADFSYLPPGGSGTSTSPYAITVHPDCPAPHFVEMHLDISADFSYATSDTFILPVGQTGYSSDVEDTTGWGHAACQGGFTDEWHSSTEQAYSPANSWKCGTPGGLYSSLLDACLETPEFVLAPNSRLFFHHWIDAETSAYYIGDCYDGGIVEIQIDGGPFEYIEPVGGYPYEVRPMSGHPFPGLRAYSGYFPYWREAIFDLSGYSGQAKIRFRFGTDQAVTREGWYVDDVVVLSGSYGPDIDLDPWAFGFALLSGEAASDLLTLSNVGDADLTYDIVVQGDSTLQCGERKVIVDRQADWLDIVPNAGVVASGSGDSIQVFVDATGLSVGSYWASLRINSNDPDEAWLEVPVELLVAEEICGDANGDESVTPGDGYSILNYFGAGPEPISCFSANANGDGLLTPSDGYHLLNYLGAGPDLNCQPCEFGRALPREKNRKNTR
jgi:hypothetical protein